MFPAGSTVIVSAPARTLTAGSPNRFASGVARMSAPGPLAAENSEPSANTVVLPGPDLFAVMVCGHPHSWLCARPAGSLVVVNGPGECVRHDTVDNDPPRGAIPVQLRVGPGPGDDGPMAADADQIVLDQCDSAF